MFEVKYRLEGCARKTFPPAPPTDTETLYHVASNAGLPTRACCWGNYSRIGLWSKCGCEDPNISTSLLGVVWATDGGFENRCVLLWCRGMLAHCWLPVFCFWISLFANKECWWFTRIWCGLLILAHHKLIPLAIHPPTRGGSISAADPSRMNKLVHKLDSH